MMTIDDKLTKEKMQGLDKTDPHPAEEGDPYNSRGRAPAKKPLPDSDSNPSKQSDKPSDHPSKSEDRPDQKDVEPGSDAASNDEALGVGPINADE